MSRPSLLRSTLSFSGGTFVSRVLGLAREVVFASAFGANAATDAFWVAFRIPNFMRRLFAEGSFSTAFVPAFTEVKEKGTQDDMRLMVSRVAGTLGAILLAITLLGVVFAPQVTALFAPGSHDEPAKFQLTADLLRITFPFLLFISLTAMAGGILNTFHRFAVPAVVPVIMNLCMIAAALGWMHFGIPDAARGRGLENAQGLVWMAWSIVAAGVLQLVVQLPLISRLGLLSWPRWGWRAPEVRKVMKLMVPTLFGSSVAQVNLLFDTLIATFLITGSQSWLAQSDRLLEFPLGVFGVALGTVILPSLSRHHVNTDHEGFSRALDWGLRTTLLISVPAMLGLVLLAQPLIVTMLQYGRFTPHDSYMASLSLSALSLGLPAFALVKVLAPAFFARQDTRTPVRAGVSAMIANMFLNVAFLALLFALWHQPSDLDKGVLDGLSRVPGLHMALGLASALASYLNLAMLWRALGRDHVYQRQPGWGRFLFRLLVSCALMSAVLLAGRWLWPDWNVHFWERAMRIAALVGAGALSFAAMQYAMGFRVRDLRGI